MWVFGYGSLIFRPDFAYEERRVGFVPGYARRFYQGSTDHRGVPGAPGRVVTLVPEPTSRCWGVAFRVAENDAVRIRGRLDYREKGGYEPRWLDFEARNGDTRPSRVLTYIGTADNPKYLGPADVGVIATQIVGARGPSGANDEYVLRLAESLRGLGVRDRHVFEVERAVLGALGADRRQG